jgi:hypothetical protein
MRKYGVACVARIESLVAPLVEEDCMKRSLIVALIFFGSFVGRLESQNVPPEVISYPETILHGGKIVTMSDNPAIR